MSHAPPSPVCPVTAGSSARTLASTAGPSPRIFEALAAPSVDAPAVAAATAAAAAVRIDELKNDATLQHGLWLLARIASASKHGDFAGELATLGIDPDRAASGIGLIGELTRVIRASSPPSSAFGELFIKSIQHTLGAWVIEQSRSLFGASLEDVRGAVSAFGTDTGFGTLAVGSQNLSPLNREVLRTIPPWAEGFSKPFPPHVTRAYERPGVRP